MLDLVHRPGARTGLWILGALGDIATTLIVGGLAIRRGLRPPTGMVTALPPFNALPLTRLDDLVIGGLDIRDGSVSAIARQVGASSGTFDATLLDALAKDLAAVDANLVAAPPLAWDAQAPEQARPALSDVVAELRTRIAAFRTRHRLDHVVVVNLVSAEPEPPALPTTAALAALEAAIAQDRRDQVTPSMCSAYACLQESCSFINFTPNAYATCPALQQLAQRMRVPIAGNDGKTGETLVKTALAPMFAARNLRVLSWEGFNMLGNGDGATLENPANRASKIRNKSGVLSQMLGYEPHAGVHINYVPSLGDWKTAWDLIHFEGFLGVRMSMQFTWQGCDSILAAPLVLDMARLADFAFRQNEYGPMAHLACFFKNPLDVEEMALAPQFEMLVAYAADHLERIGRCDPIRDHTTTQAG